MIAPFPKTPAGVWNKQGLSHVGAERARGTGFLVWLSCKHPLYSEPSLFDRRFGLGDARSLESRMTAGNSDAGLPYT